MNMSTDPSTCPLRPCKSMFALRGCSSVRLCSLACASQLRSPLGLARMMSRREKIKSTQEGKVKEFSSALDNEGRHLLYRHLRLALLRDQGDQKTQETATIPKDPLFIERPTRYQLTKLFVFHSLPYVAFGFMDNCIMLVAGDYIEACIGAKFGISTLAAAGLGNILADSLSIMCAYQVERFFAAIFDGPASLSTSQFALRRTKLVIQSARVFGIAIGCVIGMAPLLFK